MKLGIIGTGKIVKEALFAMEESKVIEMTAIFARPHSKDKGEVLAKQYNIPQIYTDYDELLNESGVDCVYIGLVNSAHYEYAKKALAAGVNVIMEKPYTSTAAEAEDLKKTAEENGLYCLEAITTLHCGIYEKTKELLPYIGPLKLIQCNYSQYSSRYKRYLEGEVEPCFDPELSGGALYDINLYNIAFVIGIMGEPESVKYFPVLGHNGVDTSGIAVLSYPDVQAVCTGAKDSDSPSFVLLQGENGWIKINGRTNNQSSLEYEYTDPDKVPEESSSGGVFRETESGEYIAEEVRHRLTRELEDFAGMIDTKDDEAGHTAMRNSVAVMQTLEAARKGAGIVFGVDRE